LKYGYIDCFSGASGDMIVGSIIDAGCDPAYIQSQIDLINIPHVTLKVEKVKRNGLHGTLARFVTGEDDPPHRALTEIKNLLNSSKLDEETVRRAISIFERIGTAEARAHDMSIENVHFHEIGAVDTICDVVAAVAGFRKLGIEKLYSSALLLGSGTIESAHGRIPVPSPATQEIAKGFPVRRIDSGVELTTPTGAAIICELAEYSIDYDLDVEAVGYGAGTRENPGLPNLLRLLVGEPLPEFRTDEVTLIEANIDDASPQEIGVLQQRLFAEGALDVYVTSVLMKKNRPGFLVSVIAERESSEKLAAVVLRESSTAGLRMRRERRRKLDREIEEVETEFGKIRIKFLFAGDIRKFSPEYDDVVEAATAAGVPFAAVYRAALQAAAKIQGDKR
jgi:uncharacterized protein (TIGR00299 family) protein